MKKHIIFSAVGILALVLIAGVFITGCGEPAGPVTLKVMAYGDASNPEGQNWVRIVEAFMKENPDITIDYELLYDEAYHQKVTANLTAGQVPYVAYMGADARWGTPWAEAGQQFDHKPYLDTNYYDMSLIPAMGDGGEVWEIPLGTSNLCTVLYMNKELVESLGFSEPKTYEDMVAMVSDAKAAGLDVISIDGADGWAWGSCLMSAIIARLSGNPTWMREAVAGEHKFTDQVFVDSLAMLTSMVDDGVIDPKVLNVDYGANLAAYGNEKALFMIQGQWAAGSIEPAVADKTVMIAWPKLPGEKSGVGGSVAAAIQVGYGITQEGAKDPAVRDAAFKFLKYFNSEPEVTQRLLDGAIVAPILKGYQVPADAPSIVKAKVALAQKTTVITDVIDAFLAGAANDALNAGMQAIVAGDKTAAELAAEVEGLVER